MKISFANTTLQQCCAAFVLCALLSSPAHSAALPDFEEDLALGLATTQLHKMGAAPCQEAPLCLKVRWGETQWSAALRLRDNKLDMVELHPVRKEDLGAQPGDRARAMLEEFALTPVRVVSDKVHCDAFALARDGQSPDKAMNMCAAQLEKLPAGANYSVWYVDEEEAERMLTEESLEKAGQSHSRTVAARLSVSADNKAKGGGVEIGYGALGSLLHPNLKP